MQIKIIIKSSGKSTKFSLTVDKGMVCLTEIWEVITEINEYTENDRVELTEVSKVKYRV